MALNLDRCWAENLVGSLGTLTVHSLVRKMAHRMVTYLGLRKVQQTGYRLAQKLEKSVQRLAPKMGQWGLPIRMELMWVY